MGLEETVSECSDKFCGEAVTHPSWEIKNLKARLRKARRFPTNTCPASRHAQMIGEYLPTKKGYPMLQEEPEHCAGSILATVAALYEARTDLLTLAQAMYAGDDSRPILKLARKVLERHRVLDPIKPTSTTNTHG
jgi:hypothetical protein